MSKEAKQPAENAEVVRKLITPPEHPVEGKDGERSPTKTERDLTAEVVAEADTAATSDKAEVLRKLVIPAPQSESEKDD